jgi:hypothetical protein
VGRRSQARARSGIKASYGRETKIIAELNSAIPTSPTATSRNLEEVLQRSQISPNTTIGDPVHNQAKNAYRTAGRKLQEATATIEGLVANAEEARKQLDADNERQEAANPTIEVRIKLGAVFVPDLNPHLGRLKSGTADAELV